MDCDQENKFDDRLHQDDDKEEVLDDHAKNSSEEIEKMNSPVPSESSGVGDKPKGSEGSDQKSAASGMHKCEFCGKEFQSGKALGGHKRFHLQALKKENKAKKAMSSDTKMSSLMSNGKPSCFLCNKDFPSKKSLYGHMRSHPDRLWRGVYPPTPSDKQGSSSSNSASIEENKDYHNYDFGAVVAPNKPDIDLSKSLPTTWRKTYKRGRERLYSDEVFEASKILMSYSQGISWSCHKKKKGKKLFKFDDDDEKHKYANWIKEGCNYVKKMIGAWNGMNTEASSSGVKDHVIDSYEEEEMMKKKEKKRMKLIVKLRTPDQVLQLHTGDAYQCNICDKSFSTFQALGGHKSRHNKEKNNRPPNDDIGQSSQSGQKISVFDLNELPDLMDDENN